MAIDIDGSEYANSRDTMLFLAEFLDTRSVESDTSADVIQNSITRLSIAGRGPGTVELLPFSNSNGAVKNNESIDDAFSITSTLHGIDYQISILYAFASLDDTILGNYFGISKYDHYHRNDNQPPSITWEQATDRSKYVEYTDPGMTYFHTREPGGENYVKFVSVDKVNGGYSEYIFNPATHQLVTSPTSYGTWNRAGPEDPAHLKLDVLPYLIWGNTPPGNDPTKFDTSTLNQRLLWAVQGFAIKEEEKLGDSLLQYETDILHDFDLLSDMAQAAFHDASLNLQAAGYVIDSVWARFVSAATEASPLVLDLDGNGIQLIDMASSHAVMWDIDQDGVREKSGWVGSGDGLLGIDRNGNGIIDGQSELFGNATEDGFTALARLDSNNDGVIDASDTAFGELRIWRDDNGNAETDQGELFSLTDLNIASISVQAASSAQTIAGNRISQTAVFTLTDGTSRTIVDAWFRYDDRVTDHDVGPNGYRPESLLLPSLRGYGDMASLLVASSNDDTLFAMANVIDSATLAQLFDPAFAVDDKFKALMFRWAGVDGVNPASRGSYSDAREIGFLEAMNGAAFTQRGNPNPLVEASATLHNAFIDAENAMFFRFLAQTQAASLFNNLGIYDYLTDTFTGTPTLNLAKLSDLVSGWHYSGATLADAWSSVFRLIDGAIGLGHLSSNDKASLNALIDQTDTVGHLNFDDVAATIFPVVGLGLNGTSGDDHLVGGAGNDSLDAGPGNDTLSGRQGHDLLDGGTGDDILQGDEGDDTLLGGQGNDTYIYSSGLDTINDSAGTDTLKFGTGVSLANLSIAVSPTNESDAIISINGTASIIIENMFTTYGGIETFSFADGTTFNAGSLIAPQNGTSGNDTLTGKDTPIFLQDYLYGQGGNDRLIGGLGDDRLVGGTGDDTYVVTAGWDRIQDDSGTDKIEFGAGYALADLTLTRSGNDLLISFKGVNAATVYGQFSGSGAVESLLFQGGTTYDLLSVHYTITGTANRDTLYGVDVGGGGDILLGMGGDDSIYAYRGDDVLDGGTGNDYLAGGLGNDRYLLSSGYDVVRDDGGVDTIDLGTVDASRISLTRSNYDLIVSVDGAPAIQIQNQFSQSGQIETLTAANGQVINLLSQKYVITGNSTSEYIYGISYGGSPNDEIHGMDGNDRLYGDLGDDLLDGGDGDDTLYGGVGNDRYYVGSGINTVIDQGSSADTSDTLYLPDGVNPADITLWRSGGSLVIQWADSAAIIQNAYDPYDAVELLAFANGVTLSLLGLQAPTYGTNADDTLYGNSENLGPRADTLLGYQGDDRLYGYDGDDILDGAEGNDSLYGGYGADTYRPGTGDNYIADDGAAGDAADRIVLPIGVKFADIAYYRLGDGDLLLAWNGGSVRINNGLDLNSAVETLQTADGASLSLPGQSFATIGSDVADTLYGNTEELGSRDDAIYGNGGDDRLYGQDGNDRLEGDAGNDTLDGGKGADSYYIGRGDDYIDESGLATDAADKIYLDSGIIPAGVTMWRLADGDLALQWNGGSVRIDNAYDQASAVEELHFADGTVWNLTTRAVETLGSGESETINGNREELGSRDDVIRGFAGNDTLNGYDGNDTLDGGLGDDSLYGSTGGDTYIVGYGWDYVQDSGATGDAADIVRIGRADLHLADLTFARLSTGDIQISWSGGAEGVVLYRGQTGTNTIEFIEFADGSRVSLAAQTFVTVTVPPNQSISGDSGANTLTGGDGNDTINGYDGADVLDGRAGNDSLYGGNGADIYHVGQGNDFLSDSGRSTDGADTIMLDAAITQGNLSFVRQADGDLLVSWTGGSFRIDRAFDLNAAIEKLVLKDGTAIDLANVSFITSGTTGADSIGGNQEELGSRNDDIRGLEGDDRLDGYDGDDRLDGGPGNDSLYGGAGNDTYVVQDYDGISDTGGTDRILLPTGVTAAGLSFVRNDSGQLQISWAGGGVLIDSAFDLNHAVETLVFAGGTTASVFSFAFETRGTEGNDTLSGNSEELGSRDDIIRGLGGNDALYGYDGNDTLDGGTGDDSLYGGAGADRYIVSGHDYISDAGAIGDGSDRIVLPAGVHLADLSLVRMANGDLLLGWASGSVQIADGLETLRAVELLEFADGSTASLTSLPFVTQGTNANDSVYGNSSPLGSHNDIIQGLDGNDTLHGQDGSDRLIGGPGDDSLYGDAGGDTYVVGDGNDYVADYGSTGDAADTIELPAGVTMASLTVSRLGDGDLLLDWGSGSVRIESAFVTSYAVEQLRFADGSVTPITSLAFETRGTGENETLYGNTETLGSHQDVIRGMDGNDRLYGYDGNDLLDPGAGDDVVFGGTGDDVYLASAGNDIFSESYSGSGSDTVRFAADADIGALLVQRIGYDLKLSWGGNSLVLDEHFQGGSYAFEAIQFGSRAAVPIAALLNLSATGTAVNSAGTAGDDTLFGNADANQLSGLAGGDLILGGDGNDKIDGGADADLLYGGAGADQIIGGTGDDMIDGGSGADQLFGGAGNDLFRVDRADDIVFENTNEGTDTIVSTASYYLYANIENLTLAAGAGDIFGVGNELTNVITGNEGSNLLIAGAGNDVVHGGAGIDSLFGQDGNDHLFGDAGVDYLVGGIGDDVIDGGTQADALYGEDGNDTLTGGSDFQTDILVGGNGDDSLHGDSGLGDYDLMDGGAGNDIYYVDTPADLTFEAASGGTDTVYANISGAGYYLYANVENLILLGTTPYGVGNELDNRLTGNAIGNYLLGGAGNDVLNGKGGNDVLFGEAGADTFVFEHGTGGDVIGDFLAGTDKIDLSALGFANYQTVVNSMHEVNGTTAIDLGGGDFIILNGVAKASLHAADFILGGSSQGVQQEAIVSNEPAMPTGRAIVLQHGYDTPDLHWPLATLHQTPIDALY